MCKEVELHVERKTCEEQAALLMATNYVYENQTAGYRSDLVERLPEASSLPSCLAACAKFVPLHSREVDVTRAVGPSSSTTAAQQEQDGVR